MTVSLQFPLCIEGDWPPVGSESIVFEKISQGYEVISPPLFVRDMSVGDIINVSQDKCGFVSSWTHVRRSGRSVVWLLRLSDIENIDKFLAEFRNIGCNTTSVDLFGCYSIDVPEIVEIDAVDAILNELDANKIAIAFPSMRHPD